MDSGQLLRLLRARYRAIISATVVGAIAAFGTSNFLPKVYEARALLIAPTMASTYAEVARSRPVLEHAIAQLGLTIRPEVLAASIDARPSQTSTLLTVSARDPQPQQAAAIANAVANRIVELAPTIVGSSAAGQAAIEADIAIVQAQIDRTEQSIADLLALPALTSEERDQLESLDAKLVSLLSVRASLQTVASSYLQTVVTLLADAVPPTDASSPNIPLATLVGALAGLTIGLAVVLIPASVRSRGPSRA